MSDQLLLQMEGIKKSFVGVEVLHGVDLDLRYRRSTPLGPPVGPRRQRSPGRSVAEKSLPT